MNPSIQTSLPDGQTPDTPSTLGATPAVRLTGITKTFGKTMVVHPIDLDIHENEFFSILGPSGCGKTTLMRMITGFETPTEGSVELAGSSVDGLPTRKRDLNMLFQSYALFPHLTVFENVAFELRVRREPKDQIADRVREALDLVRLGGLEDRKPDQLSGGQRQRVALARAVVSRPAVVLLDEPLGALDQQLRKEMQIELKRMQRDVGITFIYVTHDQEEALSMSDRIAVMWNGQLLQIGSPQEIYDSPATEFVASFIGSCNIIPATSSGSGKPPIVSGVGPVPAVADDNAETEGDRVVVAVRPERMSVSAEAPVNEWSTTGTLTEAVYLGHEWRYGIKLGTDAHVFTTVTSSQLGAELAALQIGDSISVSWDEHDARVLAK